MRRRKSEPKADIASRKASKNREFEDDYLEGTESTFGGVDPAEQSGFRQAWDDSADPGDSLDSAINVDSESQRTRKHRSLEQQRTIMFVALACSVVVVAGLAFVGTRAFTANGDADTPEFNDGENVLASPIEARSYSAHDEPLEVSTFVSLDEYFIDEEQNGTLSPSSPEAAGTDESLILSGPVFWAGRVHIAIVSDAELLGDGSCIVATLASASLRAVDIASAGDCDDERSGLGDRTACSAPNMVLLEVWPFNPDSVVEPEPVVDIRTRLESRSDGSIVSRRASLSLDSLDGEGNEGEADVSSVLAATSVLEGTPEEEVTIVVGDLRATCTLNDRAGVEVRLLPG